MSTHISRVTLHHDKYPCRTHYPFSLPLFNLTDQVCFDAPVTVFVGENGTGKSTMLQAIALACNIHIWHKEDGARCQVNPFEDQLFRYLSVDWVDKPVPGAYFGSDIFNDFRRIVDSWAANDPAQLSYFGGASLLTQSHGQSTMSYFESRYKIKGLYFLDEPETALSPKSQLKLMKIITENAGKGHAQFIIATHSPLMLGIEGAQIFSFDSSPVQETGYTDTEHYRLYKSFLAER